MANPEKGEQSVTIAGQTYTLKLGTKAMMDIQEMFSTEDRIADINKLWLDAQKGRLKHIVAFVWAGLQKYHPEFTYAKTVDLIDAIEDDQRQMKALLRAIGFFILPDEKDVQELSELGVKPDPQPAQTVDDGTGALSTATLVGSV